MLVVGFGLRSYFLNRLDDKINSSWKNFASNSSPSFQPNSLILSGGMTTIHLGYSLPLNFLDNCFCNFIN